MVDKNSFLNQNVKGLIMDLLGRWNCEMDVLQSKTPFANIRPADMRLFGQLRGRPTPLPNLHKQLGISRQAAHKSVSRLVDHGVLAIVGAPDDNKRKIVKITVKGEELRDLAALSIKKIEDDCVDRIGTQGLKDLRALLIKLNDLEGE